MGRSKIPITWIKSDASRQVTFNKRKKGMKKKAEELAILCGVDVCMICFGPTITGSGKNQPNNNNTTTAGGNNQQPQSSAGSSSSSSASANTSTSAVPFSWGMPGVSTVISKFEGLPKEERDKKKLDNTSLLEQQIKKLRRELKAKLDQNWKLEQERAYYALDERLDCYTVDDLKRLADCLLEKLRITFERISYWEQQEQEQQEQAVVVHQQEPPCSDEVEDFTSSHGGSKLVSSAFMSFVNPFSVLPPQQPHLNLNPLLVHPVGAPGLLMDESENSSLLPMGIGQTSSSHLVPNNHVWTAPTEGVVTRTSYGQVGGGDDEWEQSPDENGGPMLHSMLLSAITENSDESKAETDQTDFQAQLQQDAVTQNDYL